MAQLAAAIPYVAAAATVLQTYSQYEAGNTQAAQMKLEAINRERDADAVQAQAQRQAAIERRKAKNLMSRARAVAAASGGGVSDPTVVNLLTDIGTQGEVNAFNALYEGDTQAAALRSGAQVARREAGAVRSASRLNAASTALDGATNWYEKYGA